MSFTALHNLDVTYMIITDDVISSAFTTNDYEKIAKSYDLVTGHLLLLEAPNLYSIVIGGKRSIFFPTETRK